MTDGSNDRGSTREGTRGMPAMVWAGWAIFLLAVIGASQIGILLAKRISPAPVVVSKFTPGIEIDESQVKSRPLTAFATAQLLRDYLFREGVSPGSGTEALNSGEHWVAPEAFRLKVIAEDGGIIQVEVLHPPDLAGKRGWIDASLLHQQKPRTEIESPTP